MRQREAVCIGEGNTFGDVGLLVHVVNDLHLVGNGGAGVVLLGEEGRGRRERREKRSVRIAVVFDGNTAVCNELYLFIFGYCSLLFFRESDLLPACVISLINGCKSMKKYA